MTRHGVGTFAIAALLQLVLLPAGWAGTQPDFGDAPASYGSASSSGIDGFGWLGACVDGELANQASASADADDVTGSTLTNGTCASPGDDEDGVTFTSPITPGAMANVTVVSAPAITGCFLTAWADFNHDGGFGAGEQIFTEQFLAQGTSNPLSFAVPPGAIPGPTFLRFRCCTSAPDATCTSPTGQSNPSGEVEDYLVFATPVELLELSID